MKSFGEQVKSYRIINGLSQRELANKLDRTTNAISNWESGACYPDVRVFLSLCHILNVSPNQLLNWNEEENITEIIEKKKAIDSICKELREQKKEIDVVVKSCTDKLKDIGIYDIL